MVRTVHTPTKIRHAQPKTMKHNQAQREYKNYKLASDGCRTVTGGELHYNSQQQFSLTRVEQNSS